jgi:hypothetical protein
MILSFYATAGEIGCTRGEGDVVNLFKKLRIMFAGNKGWRTGVKS